MEYQEMMKRKNKKLLKYKLKMEIFNNSKNTSVKIKMPKEILLIIMERQI